MIRMAIPTFMELRDLLAENHTVRCDLGNGAEPERSFFMTGNSDKNADNQEHKPGTDNEQDRAKTAKNKLGPISIGTIQPIALLAILGHIILTNLPF